MRDGYVVLSGSTGALGRWIVARLAETGDNVWHLGRGRTVADVQTRVVATLAACAPDVTVPDSWRYDPFDLTSDGLGLQQPTADHIREHAEVIIHCAADTSLAAGQHCMKVNLDGTARMIEFAATCRRSPMFIHVSTAYVVGKTVQRGSSIREHEGLGNGQSQFNNYTASKAAAERLVLDSGIQAMIVRPSVLVPTTIGEWGQWMRRLAKAASIVGLVPISSDSRVDIVEAEFAAEAIVALAKHGQSGLTLNISAGREGAVRCSDLARVAASLSGRRRTVEFVSPDSHELQAFRRSAGNIQRKAMAAMRPLLPFLNMDVTFENERLLDLLPNLSRPVAPDVLCEKLTRCMVAGSSRGLETSQTH